MNDLSNHPGAQAPRPKAGELHETLLGVLGEAGLSRDPNQLRLLSQDIYQQGEHADFIAAPASLDELQATARACHEHAVALNPRGAGMSYTSGYTPDRPGVGVLDLGRLDAVLEVNEADMYVSVQAGCTWRALHDALKPRGLRTPFWGPLSGLTSTVGGGLSQNNAFFGAGVHGPASDSVTALSVVLADGTLVRTGTAGGAGGKPFWRHYGPDLTGLFLGDAGAFGYKAEASFRLIPAPEHEDWASFEFRDLTSCAEAMAAVAREGVACELFGFDPQLQRVRMQRASLAADAKVLAKVVTGQGSLLKGLKEGAKIAMSGRDFIDEAAFSLHMVVEGRSAAGVREDIGRLKRLCVHHGGKEIENSIPKIVRANPFSPLNNMLGPKGERWVPVHGIASMSKGPKVWAEIDAMFAAMRAELDAHEIQTGYLITSLSTNGFLIEPVFLWPEALLALHEASVEADWLRKLPRHAANPEATALVARARQRVIDIFVAHGCAHFQVGRAYPYAATREPGALDLVERIKAALDAKGLVNPGALGLNAP